MHRWWDNDPAERFWLEITERPDLGVDLRAPQVGDNGREYWSYSMVREVRDGDAVFHYWKPRAAIVAVLKVAGEPWQEDIVWASHGSVAREAGVSPYLRPGWRIAVEEYVELSEPVTLTPWDLRGMVVRSHRAGRAS